MVENKILFNNGETTSEFVKEYTTLKTVHDYLEDNKLSSDDMIDVAIDYLNGEARRKVCTIESDWYSCYSNANYTPNDRLLKMESNNPWLKAYRGIETDATRPEYNYIVPLEFSKIIERYCRDKDVRDNEDSIADLAKTTSLLLSMVGTFHSVFTKEQLNKMNPNHRAVIEHTVTKFKQTQTRADKQLVEEGLGFIDRLIDSEKQISDIIDMVRTRLDKGYIS